MSNFNQIEKLMDSYDHSFSFGNKVSPKVGTETS